VNGDYKRGGNRGDDRGRGGRGGPHAPRGGGGGRGRHGDREDRGNRRGGVPLSDLDPKLTELSRRVIGCAIEVHKELGPGYPKEIYLKALGLELQHEEIQHKTGHMFDVYFDEDAVGQVGTDLYVGDRFLVKIMAEHTEIGTQPRHELRAVLRAADLELGLIINFGERRLKDGLVRVLNPDKLRELRGEVEEEEYEEEEFEEADGEVEEQ